MSRLGTYLVRLLTRESAGLLAVMLGLLFLVQCLRIFDVVVVQGQNIWTLAGQAALSMPPLAIVIAYVCMGIGMVRALGALQASQELHIIHASRQLRPLFGGIALFAVGGAVLVLLLSNFIEPWANRRLDDWSASVAADVVGRTLTPHRLSQVVDGVTMVIGGREGTGNITDFFADDRRDPQMRRTYSAKTATVATDGSGYLLELHDGTLQYLSAADDFSEISFKTYNIGLDKLTQAADNRDALAELDSWQIVAAAVGSGHWGDASLRGLALRGAEGLRAFAMCALIAALAAFPHARRGGWTFPLELVPLFVAYAEKSISENIAGPPALTPFLGSALVLLTGLALLCWRLRLFRPAGRAARLGAATGPA